MYNTTEGVRDGGKEEGIERLSVVSLDVKHGSSSNFDMLSSRCWDIGSVRDIGLVDTFSGLDNLV